MPRPYYGTRICVKSYNFINISSYILARLKRGKDLVETRSLGKCTFFILKSPSLFVCNTEMQSIFL